MTSASSRAPSAARRIVARAPRDAHEALRARTAQSPARCRRALRGRPASAPSRDASARKRAQQLASRGPRAAHPATTDRLRSCASPGASIITPKATMRPSRSPTQRAVAGRQRIAEVAGRPRRRVDLRFERWRHTRCRRGAADATARAPARALWAATPSEPRSRRCALGGRQRDAMPHVQRQRVRGVDAPRRRRGAAAPAPRRRARPGRSVASTPPAPDADASSG